MARIALDHLVGGLEAGVGNLRHAQLLVRHVDAYHAARLAHELRQQVATELVREARLLGDRLAAVPADQLAARSRELAATLPQRARRDKLRRGRNKI